MSIHSNGILSIEYTQLYKGDLYANQKQKSYFNNQLLLLLLIFYYIT